MEAPIIHRVHRSSSPSPYPAIVLAAGRGSRMRPLTDTCPKPLLPLAGKPLMQWTLEAMARDGIGDVVVNTGWLWQQIPDRLGDGSALGLRIAYSHEAHDFGDALETAGGIVRALPLLANEVFWVAAGDVFAPDFVFDPAAAARFAAGDALAHLWLVPNPPQHPQGDFHLRDDGIATAPPADDPAPRLTYSTIGLYRAELFGAPWCDIPPGNPAGIAAPLAPLLRAAMAQGRVTAERHDGRWADVGTPERLEQWQAIMLTTPQQQPPQDLNP
ncbi:N-acetylmuramate alpha-1-phosphate uridylyltransferase MurU [Xylophilus sp. GOD-11R]|uniref:N-acetylmuramate alpha-1-phosphate uridylyltransferase MurU n=1 Tax=Xylophilus sp. GOD-11R TaxID=3089814 RepID=UPI00298CB054|nr:nucleotidyltransferase family protein [Xylophilus sp. GOD-11R]WPB57093.1 nucleotidyltransferase family protein [Xylophilus sp. GOD-11R]